MATRDRRETRTLEDALFPAAPPDGGRLVNSNGGVLRFHAGVIAFGTLDRLAVGLGLEAARGEGVGFGERRHRRMRARETG